MRARTTTALVLLLALTACGGPRGNPSEEPSGAPATPGGPSDDPVAVEPTAALLDWQDTGTEAGTRYLKGPEWEALGNEAGTRVDLQADGTSVGIAAGRDRTISTTRPFRIGRRRWAWSSRLCCGCPPGVA